MTYQEYLNQADPVRLASGSVIIEDSEILLSIPFRSEHAKSVGHLCGQYIDIPFRDQVFKYFVVDGETTLRTIDDQANPIGYSVFRLKQAYTV